MLRFVNDPTFIVPDHLVAPSAEPLIVHQHTNPSLNSAIVLFVHGLGGDRYATWGNFPAFLFQELPGCDIGLYSYRTFLGRIKFWRSISLDAEAEAFANLLRGLEGYDSIVLVGHSMGGLLCKAVVAYLVDSLETATLDRIKGEVLMAAPQLGSLWIPRAFASLTSDTRALSAHSDFVRRIEKTFTNRVNARASTGDPSLIPLPVWIVAAANDRWVDPLSAGVGIPDVQKMLVRGLHTEIVKPTSTTSDAYVYVRRLIQTVCNTEPRLLPTAIELHQPIAEDRTVVRRLLVGAVTYGATALLASTALYQALQVINPKVAGTALLIAWVSLLLVAGFALVLVRPQSS